MNTQHALMLTGISLWLITTTHAEVKPVALTENGSVLSLVQDCKFNCAREIARIQDIIREYK